MNRALCSFAFLAMIASVCSFTSLAVASENTEAEELRVERWGSWFVPVDPTTVTLDVESFDTGTNISTGETLLNIPGVAGVRRGGGQVEPVMRGLGHERVTTQVSVLPLFGACPGRMDPPVNYLPLLATDALTVVRGLPSVTLGAAGTGGRIVLDDELRDSRAEEFRRSGMLRGGWDSSRRARVAEGLVELAWPGLDMRIGAEALRSEDYDTARDLAIPSRQEAVHGNLSATWRPSADTQVWSTMLMSQEGLTDFPALPMDMRESDTWIATAGARRHLEAGPLTQLQMRLGYSLTDHVMDNEFKANRPTLLASTDSEARTASMRVSGEFTLPGGWTSSVGSDVSTVWRDATRERTVVASSARFFDRLWPDGRQIDTGFFAETRSPRSTSHNFRWGLRADRVSTRLGATDDRALGGQSVAEAYVRFYGDSAADYDRDEWNTSANAQWFAFLPGPWRVDLGVGLTSRSAGLTERAYAFAPAPGGFLVGNPSLESERAIEVQAGIDWQGERSRARLSPYARRFSDYIATTTVAQIDVNGDGSIDRVRGFENVDAIFWGFEFDAHVFLGERVAFPVNLSYVRARNTSDETDLPEIPPLEGRAAVRVLGSRGRGAPWWLEAGVRAVADQSRVDPAFGEDSTPGFVTADLRAEFTPVLSTVVRMGVDNLLDHPYHEHLTREAMLPTEDLLKGDEIPAPGRSWHLSLGWRY